MWLLILALILGFIALVWSADKFLSGAASTANHLGVSKMLIGLTVVSVGTSAPEILVAFAASFHGYSIASFSVSFHILLNADGTTTWGRRLIRTGSPGRLKSCCGRR